MEPATPITTYRLTDHAQTEMARRHITVAYVTHVLAAPEHTEVVRPGRVVYQARVTWGPTATTYLLRVFINIDRQPPAVVTVYRTSKLAKYEKGTA
jgi:hypothetical protein